ncbi:MAG: hypothetical protein WKH64_16025 [Chloroflexia bacterium]
MYFSPGYFAANTFFATLVYFILPIPLGLATRAFFDTLSGDSAGLNAWSAIAVLVAVRSSRCLPVRRSAIRGARCSRRAGAASAEPVRRRRARLRSPRAAGVGRRDAQPLPRRPRER